MLGREEEARKHANEVIRLDPKFSLKIQAEIWGRFTKNQTDIDHVIDAYRKAGLPD
jgi:hypothetical protein